MVTDIFHDPQRYGDMRAWREEAIALHEQGPIHHIEADGFPPFWAVIGHDEVMQVERAPGLSPTNRSPCSPTTQRSRSTPPNPYRSAR